MATSGRLVYWDANVLCSYVQDLPCRAETVEDLLDRARAGVFAPVTSVLSIAEVAFALDEYEEQELSEQAEEMIEELWRPGSPITLVEFYEAIAHNARYLVRQGRVTDRALKPMDAIHLATALRLQVADFHTYDEKLHRWSGVLGFPVQVPITQTPRLPGT
jgi:predicted nucleic acid-binding protein